MKSRSIFEPGEENYSVKPSFEMAGKSLDGFNELFQIVIFHDAILRRQAYENVFSMLRNCQVQSAVISRQLSVGSYQSAVCSHQSASANTN